MGSGDPSAWPSRSPAGKGPAHRAVLQGGSPQRGGKGCALGDSAEWEWSVGSTPNHMHWEVTSSLSCMTRTGLDWLARAAHWRSPPTPHAAPQSFELAWSL